MATPSLRTSVWSGRSVRQATVTPEPEADNAVRARRRIIAQYARMEGGRVIFCLPSQAELAGVVPRRLAAGSNWKVIYPSVEVAQAAARELQAIGAESQYAYVCPRSKSGHAHLTRTKLGARRD